MKLPCSFSLILVLFICVGSLHAQDRTVLVRWNVSTAAEVELSGFRLYRTGNPTALCETTDPDAREMTCSLGVTDSEATYTMTSFDRYGMESDHSQPMVLALVDAPGQLGAEYVFSTGSDAPLSVRFDGSMSTGQPSEYTWVFGDGSPEAGGAVVDHVFPAAGSYQVKLTVTREELRDEITKTIRIEAPVKNRIPDISVSASSTTGPAPLKVQFDGSASSDPDGDDLSYSWNFGDGSAVGKGKRVNHRYTTSGNYTAVLTVSDGRGGNATASLPVIVTVGVEETGGDNSPQALITVTKSTGHKEGEEILSFTFDGSPSSPSTPKGSIVQYAWNFGDGATATGKRVAHVYPAPLRYLATLTVTDDKGRQAKASIEVDLVEEEQAGMEVDLLPVYKLLLLN